MLRSLALSPSAFGRLCALVIACTLTPLAPAQLVPTDDSDKIPVFGVGTQLWYTATIQSTQTPAPPADGAEATKPTVARTTIDTHYLVYGAMASGTFEVACRATLRAKEAEPFRHNGDFEQPAPPGPDRMVYLSLDDENRLGSVHGHWTNPAFDALTVSPTPPKFLTASPSAEGGVRGEIVHVSGVQYIAELKWARTENTLKGKLVRPVGASRNPADPELTAYSVSYELREDGRVMKLNTLSRTRAADGATAEVTMHSDHADSGFLVKDLHFQRRAELATTKGQFRLIHPAASLDERAAFSVMLRDRLFGSPFAKVAMDMFDDYVESLRPLAAKYLEQLVGLEARYGEPAPDFAGVATSGETWSLERCTGKPTVLVFLGGLDHEDNERLLTELETLRQNHQEAIHIVGLSPGTVGDAKAPTALGKLLAEEQPAFPILPSQGMLFGDLGIRHTPTVVVIDSETIVKSALVGFHFRSGDTLRTNVQSTITP
ncbi:MAG: redoxin domain-containing protein [Planctomycetota bacterium]